MTIPTVCVRKGGPVRLMVREVMEAAGVREVVAEGDVVLVKPNFVRPAVSATGVTTNLEVVESIIDVVRSLGATPVIGESCGVPFRTADVFSALGVDALAKKLDVRLVDLDTYPAKDYEVPRPQTLDTVHLTSLLDEVDSVISVPVAKTHNVTTITGAVKNMHGTVPDTEKWRTHLSGVNEAIVDIAQVARPDLSVLDMTTCLEGHGPMTGDPVPLDAVAACLDPVAIDAFIAHLTGYEPEDVRHLVLARDAGLGQLEYAVEGDAPEPRRFARARFITPMLLTQQYWTRVQYFLVRRFGIDLRSINKNTGGLILQYPRFTGKCTGCGDCVEACPVDALTEGKPPSISSSKCLCCGICWNTCSVEGAAGYTRSLRWLLDG